MGDQVLRTLDKHDKIGTDGVIALLQKSEAEFGAGLDPARAILIGSFMDCKGANNAETLAKMRDWFDCAPKFMARLRLSVDLDRGEEPTALDRLLAMTPNEDQTWRDGGRPANITWALDDIIEAVRWSAPTEGGE